MSDGGRFPVVLLWHMHQPQYRDALSGEQVLPWTWLHAIKDYVDMVAHLEAEPAARVVVNFTPVLLEQLEDLAQRVQEHLHRGTPLPDPLLRTLGAEPLPGAPAERLALLNACLRANRTQLIDRYPPYAALADLAASFATPDTIGYASDRYLRELAIWYHLAWLGETVKRSDLRAAALLQQEREFSPAQRRQLLELVGEVLSSLLPRYRALAARGQIELSLTPYAHPILPLLLDFRVAHEAVPDAPLPAAAARYPGGAERARWHLAEGQKVFERILGRRAVGCWPSEGAISRATLELLDSEGFQWAASGGAVLANSLKAGAGAESSTAEAVHAAWQLPGTKLRCLFRDDELSDLIGFTYQSWHGDDAVANFTLQLAERARAARAAGGQLLVIALDGENAWEHYPFNGYYFLRGLYTTLATHPELELCSAADALARGAAPRELKSVSAGSWVHGTLATWIGERDKNAGWELLIAAKQAVDTALASGRFDAAARARIEHQLAQCESSDWFWWFGDYNPEAAVREFDLLYRHQLARLYQMLELPAPESLARVISVGRGAPEGGGVMRRAQE